MKPLPSEIISLIFNYLLEDTSGNKHRPKRVPGATYYDVPPAWRSQSLAKYSVISRQWQGIVEPIIWKRLCIRGHLSVLNLSRCTTGNDWRRARVNYIRHILWQPYFVLPKVTDFMYRANTNEYLYEWYDQEYHKALGFLFLALHSWGEQHPGLELVFSDHNPHCGTFTPRYSEYTSSLRDILFKHRKALPSCLKAKHLEPLPSPVCVTSIGVTGTWLNAVLLSSFGLIFERLPNVKHVLLQDFIWMGPSVGDIRRLLRQEMIDFIRCVPSSVESLELSVMPEREWSPFLHNDELRNHRLTYVGLSGMDYLSTRLHNLSMRLQSLTLSHIRISKALFWPSAENSTNAPYWPKLERLRVLNMPPYNEDGSPLLGLDPPLTREAAVRESLANAPPKDRYSDRREYIKSADLGILYRAMGTAAQRMPRLQIMGLSLLNYRTGEESNESLEFSRDKSARIAHLRINTQWGYRPGMEVISAWGLKGAVAEEFYETMDVFLPWYVEAQ